MIDVNKAVQLNIGKTTSTIISLILVSLTLATLISLLWVLTTKDDIGEDWLLTLVALFPSALLITSAWFYILLAKKSFNSEELLQVTFNILSKEIPLALQRRLFYYTKMYNGSDQSTYFKEIGSSKESLLDSNYLKEKTQGYIQITSNVILGLTSCQYKIQGGIIDDYPLVGHLTIGLQINVNQVEATYTFDNLNKDQREKLKGLVKHTFEGAESAGYKPRCTEFENSIKFKARMDFANKDENANLLLDSCDKLFFVQDFSLMTGSLISLLRGEKL